MRMPLLSRAYLCVLIVVVVVVPVVVILKGVEFGKDVASVVIRRGRRRSQKWKGVLQSNCWIAESKDFIKPSVGETVGCP